MASGRSCKVRYGTKGASQPKVRPWHSTSADLFDRLKGSVGRSKDASPASSLPEKGGQRTPIDEESSCGESPLQIRRTVSHSKYSYSHSPRTTSPAKSKLKSSTRHFEPSPPSLTTTSTQQPSSASSSIGEEDILASEAGERLKKKQDTRKVDKKDHLLKVFDFELSSDEDNRSENSSTMKKAKVGQKSLTDGRQLVVSRKQTSLKQYARSTDVRSRSQMSGGSDKKTAKKLKKVASNHKPLVSKGDDNESTKGPPKALKNRKPSESDLRSTISKLLASKAEGLKAKATTKQAESTAQQPPPGITSAKSGNRATPEEKEQAVESVNGRIKRKSPPTAALAAKKVPPKRAKIEKNDLGENRWLESQVLSNSMSDNVEVLSKFSENSPQAKLSGVKTNGIYSSGTLRKSDIATRTRSSRKERNVSEKDSAVDHEKEGSDTHKMGSDTVSGVSQHESLVGSDLTDSQSSQVTEVDHTESPRSTVSSSSESVRGGRSSPRYTARGRRMSGVSPTLQASGSDIPISWHPMSPSGKTSPSQGARLGKVNPAKGRSAYPYGFDSDQDTSEACKADSKKYLHVVQPKPSLRKSSSATSYSLTSRFDLSDAQASTSSRLKPHGSSSHLPSRESTTSRGDAASDVTVEPCMPYLKKSSSWPQRPASATRPASSSGLLASHRMLSKGSLASSSSSVACSSTATTEKQIICAKEEKQLYTVVRNVRQAHECLEIGESQQFFDEVHYLLDSIKPSQPLSVRCLGVFNLCTHYFDTEFSRQLRAHSLTPKITTLLKDCLEHPTLCLSAAVLFYVMTRDKLNTEWDNSGAALLVGMLSKEESFFTSDLSTGKAQREMTRLRNKAKTILQKVKNQSCSSACSTSGVSGDPTESNSSAAVSAGEGGLVRGEVEAFGRGGSNHSDILKEKPHHVNPDHVSVQELACECLISLTHHQHNPQWLRHQLRLLGGLDLVANLVISSIDGVASVDLSSLPLCSQDKASPSDYVTGISYRLVTLERRMKALEHATVRNKDNQSYLVVFDGSVLLSKVVRLVAILPSFLKLNTLRSISEDCLLTAFKVLLNLTHDLQLGCHRLGEQNDIMIIILDILFQLSTQMSDEDNAFDITVLALSLLINLTEMCTSNRTLLEVTKVPWIESDLSDSEEVIPEAKESENVHSNNSSIKLLVQLFLERYYKAESTQIQVPTPQRLSQLTSSSTPHTSPCSQTLQQPQKPETSSSKRDLLPSFTTRMQKAPLTCSQGEVALSQDSTGSQGERGLSWIEGGVAARVSKSGDRTLEPRSTENGSDSEEEEALEKVDIDPLVFSREEFDAALHQAGRHMEDSIVAAYTALLLGILSKHNQDTLDYVRSQMPSRSFSEMIGILAKLVSFMNMTGSATGLESIKHIIKYLETL